MDNTIIYVLMPLTLLNLGLAIFAIYRTSVLRRDLRTPVVKRFNQDFKRKPVDIPRPENFQKNNQNDRNSNRPQNQQNRNKNNQMNRNNQAPRRPAARPPEVFSNENSPAVVNGGASEQPVAEGRRPLPQRPTAVAEPVRVASAPETQEQNGGDESVGFDRTKMNHGRRVTAQKAVIEDEETV